MSRELFPRSSSIRFQPKNVFTISKNNSVDTTFFLHQKQYLFTVSHIFQTKRSPSETQCTRTKGRHMDTGFRERKFSVVTIFNFI